MKKIACLIIIFLFLLTSTSNFTYAKTENKIKDSSMIIDYISDCPCNYDNSDITTMSNYEYSCGNDQLSNRHMEFMITDNPEGGSRHNPCWGHLGIHTYFIGKDGIYNFNNIVGNTRHTEMCGLGNPGTNDMSICNNFGTWPIDGNPWNPDSWMWYLETSIDGIHWELVSKYPFDKVKGTTPFGPTSVSNQDFRFIRLRMPIDRKGVGLAGYMDNSGFEIDESKVQEVSNEGFLIERIQGEVKTHKYRSMELSSLLIQVSHDGTTDWDTVREISITNNQKKSFDVSIDPPILSRFVRLVPQAGQWNGMPATPSFIDYSTIEITHSQGAFSLNCEEDTMECSLSPVHPCYVGGQGYSGTGRYNTCENYMMSGSFQHTYPLLSTSLLNNAPVKPEKPEGPSSGKAGEEYTFTVSTTDSNGNEIYYMFDFDASGEHYLKPWIGPYSSGEEASINFKWGSDGSYSIKVKAKDKYGYESDWSDPLKVSMPKSKSSFNYLFQRFFLKFPIFQRLFTF